MRAALVYPHLTDKRQRVIADAVGKAAKAAPRKAKTPKPTNSDDTASGTKVARPRGKGRENFAVSAENPSDQ